MVAVDAVHVSALLVHFAHGSALSTSLFPCRTVRPYQVALRVWEGYLALGEAFALRVAVGITSVCSEKILAINNPGEALKILNNFPEDIGEETLFNAIKRVGISSANKRAIEKLMAERAGQ